MRLLVSQVRRWGKARLLAVGALAVFAILAALVVPSALLAGGWAALPADLLVGISAPAHASAPAAPASSPSSPLAPSGERPAAPSPTTTPGSASSSRTCAATQAELAGERHLLALLNAHRAAAGVPALALDPALSAAARAHSCDMDQHHHLSHTGSDGSSPVQRIAATGGSYRAAGENIGETVGYALLDGLDREDHDMMAEPLTPGNHHWNIVSPAYTRVGLGVVYRDGQLYFTEDFVG